MGNNIFEIKSFAKIQQTKVCCGQKFKKINFFDKIYFEEKNNGFGGIEIRKKEGHFGNIKFPTNAENSCFLIAKEMQKLYAKKNKGTKPKSIVITIEKNIPLNCGLGGASSNAESVKLFLDKFWGINFFNEENFLETEQKFFFSNKKIFLLIPKYISIEKKFYESNNNIKKIFPDLEKFIKIFLDNGSEFSDISGKGSAVFGIFNENISEIKINNIKNIFIKFGEFIII